MLAGTLLAAMVAAQKGERFDYKVREMFFAGFAGDAEQLERGIKAAAETLAKEPEHPEALVWHGGGLFFKAGESFRKGDGQQGTELYTRAVKEMDRAVELSPKNLGVRIPRGSVYLVASRFMGPQFRHLVEKGVGDFQFALDAQRDRLSQMSSHQKGELIFNLAESYSRLGNKEKAAEYFELLEKEVPNTEYAKRAALWKETGSVPPARAQCVGCHSK